MPIAFDNVTKGVNTSSISHTCTGSNLILLVGVSINDSNPARRAVNSLTYNGIALTPINTSDRGSSVFSGLYYLINPATGSNTLAISITADYYSFAAISLTGAKQSAQPDNNGTVTGNSNSPEKTITPVADNSWIVSVVGAQGIIATTGAQTEKWNDNHSGAQNGAGGVQGPISPAASTNSTWSLDHGDEWGVVVASIAPAPAAGTAMSFSGFSFTGNIF